MVDYYFATYFLLLFHLFLLFVCVSFFFFVLWFRERRRLRVRAKANNTYTYSLNAVCDVCVHHLFCVSVLCIWIRVSNIHLFCVIGPKLCPLPLANIQRFDTILIGHLVLFFTIFEINLLFGRGFFVWYVIPRRHQHQYDHKKNWIRQFSIFNFQTLYFVWLMGFYSLSISFSLSFGIFIYYISVFI